MCTVMSSLRHQHHGILGELGEQKHQVLQATVKLMRGNSPAFKLLQLVVGRKSVKTMEMVKFGNVQYVQHIGLTSSYSIHTLTQFIVWDLFIARDKTAQYQSFSIIIIIISFIANTCPYQTPYNCMTCSQKITGYCILNISIFSKNIIGL